MNERSPHSGDVFEVEYREYESPSHAIAVSVAILENVDVTKMDPLFESVDPDALDRLFQRANTTEPLVVEVMVGNYLVTIRGCGAMTIREPTRH